MEDAVDMVNHPKHYTSHPSGIEVIEVTRHMSFDLGNAVKYMLRHNHKGSSKQDLEKAAWYLRDHISAFGYISEIPRIATQNLRTMISYTTDDPLHEPLSYIAMGAIGTALRGLEKHLDESP